MKVLIATFNFSMSTSLSSRRQSVSGMLPPTQGHKRVVTCDCQYTTASSVANKSHRYFRQPIASVLDPQSAWRSPCSALLTGDPPHDQTLPEAEELVLCIWMPLSEQLWMVRHLKRFAD